MADDNSLALLDPQNQQNYVKGMGLPPVLPSLSKPKPQSQTSVTPQIGTPPLGALPPVTTLDPSPEQQQVSQLRTKLQADTNKLPATEALWNKASQYHKDHPGFVGRLGQVGAGLLRGVDIASEALSGGASALVPGSIYNHNMNVAQDKADITAAEGNAKTAAEAEKDRAAAYKDLNPAVAKPEPTKFSPTTFQGKNGEPVILQEEGPGAGTLTAKPGFDVKPDKASAGATPLTAQDAQERWNMWSQLNPQIAKKITTNPFKEGMLPEQAKEVETALNQSSGREQGQVHVEIAEAGLADKQAKEREAAVTTATQGRLNLYAQQNYMNNMQKWFKLPPTQYAKDNALITDLLNAEKTGHGVLGGVFGSTGVSAIIGGPAGIAAGAGIGALANVLSGPSGAILESLKKQGISPQGYAAMQAYLNALPARMAFEITNQGLKASSMRFGALIQKVMNTIPAPNTPQASFNNSFAQYYNPMVQMLAQGENNSEHLPKGWQAPAYNEFYPEEAPPSGPWTKYQKK
jgi:hypothetical protein